MKKLLITAVCSAAAVGCYAQGTMQFQNTVFSRITITDNGSNVVATSASIGAQTGTTSTGVIDVGLLWGTSSAAIEPNLAAVFTMNASGGTFAGNGNLPVSTTSPGDLDWFQVVAWDSSYGNTLAGMEACITGGGFWGSPGSAQYGTLGAALQFTLGPNPSPGTVMFGSAATTGVFHGFNLTSSPEPATMALGGLGAAALLLFRRRK